MSEHSAAEAKNQLSKLIDRALKGEGIVIAETALVTFDRGMAAAARALGTAVAMP
jgi:antitoxin (DNA-binding transcriptional repressor) of toxin-antitoxin stability system